MKRLLEFFGSWRPVFSADPMTGLPTVSVSIESSQSEMTLKTIFDYLRTNNRQIYIAIDEFQQITNSSFAFAHLKKLEEVRRS